jgi:hypothetical protein
MDNTIIYELYQKEIQIYQEKIKVLEQRMSNEYLDESYHELNIKMCQQDIIYYTNLIKTLNDKL